jgi:hypothetical protein
MKIDFKKIINIKNKSDLKKFDLNGPIFQSNYLFHYLIQLGNLTGLKLQKYPIYKENVDELNGFDLAAKEYNPNILKHLIDNYPEYIYNRNAKRIIWTYYLPFEDFSGLIKKYPKLDWFYLIINSTPKPFEVHRTILTNLKFKELNNFITSFDNWINNQTDQTNQDLMSKIQIETIFSIVENYQINQDQKIKLLDKYNGDISKAIKYLLETKSNVPIVLTSYILI